MTESAEAAPGAQEPSTTAAAEVVLASLSVDWPILTLSERKARYGVAYVRSICAQAGVGLSETAPGEDVLAVDCDVQFAPGNVRVQVKCTSELTIGGRSASLSAKTEWFRKWQESRLPVYLVLVVVPGQATDWIEHQLSEGTFHRTAAFWRRLGADESIGSRISIPKDQRFEAATLGQWHSDLVEVFEPAGSTP